jgi:flagellar biosynthesis chaperone FliJ
MEENNSYQNVRGTARKQWLELTHNIEKLERELSAIKQIGVDRYLKGEWHQESFVAGCDAGIYMHHEALERRQKLERERDDWREAYERLAAKLTLPPGNDGDKVGQ